MAKAKGPLKIILFTLIVKLPLNGDWLVKIPFAHRQGQGQGKGHRGCSTLNTCVASIVGGWIVPAWIIDQQPEVLSSSKPLILFFGCGLGWKPSDAVSHVGWLTNTLTHTLRQKVGKKHSVLILGHWNLVCRFSEHYIRDCSNMFNLNMSPGVSANISVSFRDMSRNLVCILFEHYLRYCNNRWYLNKSLWHYKG